jgi:RNA polymerase sigma factor (sigma-70 family)
MSSPTLPDPTATVVAARGGDPAAWEALLERYDRLIIAVCRGHRLSDADIADVRQTTWLRAMEYLDRLNHPDRIAAWLATIARHESLRLLRHARRVMPAGDDVDAWHDDRAAPEASLLASERSAAVRGAVTALEQRDKRLIALLYGEEPVSYAEAGRVLRMPLGSVGPTRGRVLDRLRRQAPVASLAAAA